MIQLTLLTRAGCHLCDTMKAVVTQAATHRPIALQETDISTDDQLEARFGHEIPVLLWNERVVARTRISLTDLLDRLDGPEKETG